MVLKKELKQSNLDEMFSTPMILINRTTREYAPVIKILKYVSSCVVAYFDKQMKPSVSN